ncbi:hypothetical protein [Terriglobus aquaticus]|uniref:Uncharacterized protein n=1 Tax=Terriglobus aquaticus TaxID=940139 RepID=A0ABW9KQN3_9BACT|nr:hypothetical protein [Terriglobus aquaticus]
MRHSNLLFCWLALAFPCMQAQDKPIPNQDALRQRAIVTAEHTMEQRDRYECRERQVQNDLDGKGKVKKSTVTEQDFFFLHGRPIMREISRDGKPLSDVDKKKQDDRVRKQIEDAEKAFKKDKRGDGGPMSSRNFLRLAKLANERRVMVSGRPTIVFDVIDNPDNKGGDIPQRIVAAMRGTISVDEETGHVQDLNVTGVRDVKIAGGLVANIHKGFQLHTISGPQKDGVWLLKAIYGSGDARMGLFFHPAASFKAEVESCRLYNVEADATVKEVEGKQ